MVFSSQTTASSKNTLIMCLGARLRITALRATSGQGIELLEYLAPWDGKPFPTDEKSSDLVHRQTMLVATDAGETAQRVTPAKSNFVSSGVIVNPNTQLGLSKAFVVRNPDGHAVEIEQK